MWPFRSDEDTFCRVAYSQDRSERKPEAEMSRKAKCDSLSGRHPSPAMHFSGLKTPSVLTHFTQSADSLCTS